VELGNVVSVFITATSRNSNARKASSVLHTVDVSFPVLGSAGEIDSS